MNVPLAPVVNVVVLADVIAGAWSTTRVNVWVAVPDAFVAFTVTMYVPPVPAAGVPESTPVVVLSVTPEGSAPVSEKIGAGKPIAVTVKVPAVPVVNVVVFAEVITGAWLIVNVKVCVADTELFDAFRVITYVPPVPGAAVPDKMPDVKRVMPVGKVPVSEYTGLVTPVEVTVNVPLVPAVKVV